MKVDIFSRGNYEIVNVNSPKWLDLNDLKNEIWVDIKDFEGLYQISNYGRVKSLKRKTKNNACYKDRILKQGKNSKGYWLVVLCKDDEKYTKKVHILVANAFIPNVNNKPIIDHIEPVDDDCNNCVYNLRWFTMKENSQHSIELHRNSPPPRQSKKGITHKQSKPVIQWTKDGILIKQWGSLHEIERELKYARSCIANVCKGRTKLAYGFKWTFELYDEREVKNTDESNINELYRNN